MEALATAEEEVLALRRGKVRRLDGLGHACKGRLRIAGACNVLAGWLLIPQAAAIAWAVQTVLVERTGAHGATTTALAALLALGLLRAGLAWMSRAQADTAVEAIRADLRTGLIRRLFANGPL
jgi:ATP-binding cassette subfamily C protein CydD